MESDKLAGASSVAVCRSGQQRPILLYGEDEFSCMMTGCELYSEPDSSMSTSLVPWVRWQVVTHYSGHVCDSISRWNQHLNQQVWIEQKELSKRIPSVSLPWEGWILDHKRCPCPYPRTCKYVSVQGKRNVADGMKNLEKGRFPWIFLMESM